MFKTLSSRFLTITWMLFFVVSAGSAAYFFNQLSLSTPPLTAGPLAANKSYGVTIDLTQYDDAALKQTLEALHASGLTWLRQPIRWADIEPEPGHFNWQPLDRIITAITNFNQLSHSKKNATLPTQPIDQPSVHPTIYPPNHLSNWSPFSIPRPAGRERPTPPQPRHPLPSAILAGSPVLLLLATGS